MLYELVSIGEFGFAGTLTSTLAHLKLTKNLPCMFDSGIVAKNWDLMDCCETHFKTQNGIQKVSPW